MNKDLSDKEIENFSNLTNKVLKEICRISDAHNIDRDSTLKYFADMLTTFTKVATIQNYDSKQTNADRIRNMTDEELAVNMMCPNENKAYIIVGKDISKQTIQRVTIGSDKILEFCTKKRGFAISDIGKKVLLTREEAEAKLKEMGEK